jgi:hypothetical protein
MMQVMALAMAICAGFVVVYVYANSSYVLLWHLWVRIPFWVVLSLLMHLTLITVANVLITKFHFEIYYTECSQGCLNHALKYIDVPIFTCIRVCFQLLTTLCFFPDIPLI